MEEGRKMEGGTEGKSMSQSTKDGEREGGDWGRGKGEREGRG